MDLNESFLELEKKLSRAGEVLRRAVADKHNLEKALEQLKQDTSGKQERLDALQREIQALRREREEVRMRVEKLLDQIEQLTDADSTG